LKKEISLRGLDLFGLVIIAIGTGGIKPCVAAFGGDQFNPRYTTMISMIAAISCNGHDSCYPLAFGVPAALMILATVFFVLGSKYYKKYPPKENVIFRVVAVVWVSKVCLNYPMSMFLGTAKVIVK
uniref:Sulfate_transp domain-containing protein n=1 Tax=Ascaris lumbricoides TaxID=6252 RepID=A0A0M3HI61_ASCLU